MRIAFVDDYCHLGKTESTLFIPKLLKKEHNVKVFYRTGVNSFPEYNIREINKFQPNVIVFFQRLPNVLILRRFLCTSIVFIPMYDSRDFWKKNLVYNIGYRINEILTQLLINPSYVCFSKSDYERYSRFGNSIYVQYFPKPKKQVKQNKPVLFFWERIDALPFEKVMSEIDLKQFSKVYFMQRNDPNRECLHYSFLNLPKNVKVITKWLSKKDYSKIMDESNIAIAPRLCEGIGHGFLDYLSRGMCVFAYDLPTHSDYIVSGVNGVLFKDRIPDINNYDWRRIGLEARNEIVNNQNSWVIDKVRLLKWFRGLV